VVAGEWRPNKEEKGEQIRQEIMTGRPTDRRRGSTKAKIDNSLIALHPKFRKFQDIRYDIALITLSKAVNWSDKVSPVCLPDSETELFAGSNATLVGWGNQEEEIFGEPHRSVTSEVLMKVDLPVLSNEVCQSWLDLASPSKMVLDSSQLCAGYRDGRHDGCQGDSGGPLTARLDGVTLLIGVVSVGVGCGQPLLPGIYTRVNTYTRWIKGKIEGHNK